MVNLHRLYLDKKEKGGKDASSSSVTCACVCIKLVTANLYGRARGGGQMKRRKKPISLFLSVLYIKKPIRERYANGS